MCFLKKNKCNVTNSSNFISGGKNCIRLSAVCACPPKYWLEYQGCNSTKIEGVTSFESAATFVLQRKAVNVGPGIVFQINVC